MTAFASPATGECFWCISNGVSKPVFEKLLATFAEEAGAGPDRIIVLVLDNAGWHGLANLIVPKGIRRLFRPAYTPEVSPAEHPWEVLDEPIINKHIPDLETLESIVSSRRVRFTNDREALKDRTGFHR